METFHQKLLNLMNLLIKTRIQETKNNGITKDGFLQH